MTFIPDSTSPTNPSISGEEEISQNLDENAENSEYLDKFNENFENNKLSHSLTNKNSNLLEFNETENNEFNENISTFDSNDVKDANDVNDTNDVKDVNKEIEIRKEINNDLNENSIDDSVNIQKSFGPIDDVTQSFESIEYPNENNELNLLNLYTEEQIDEDIFIKKSKESTSPISEKKKYKKKKGLNIELKKLNSKNNSKNNSHRSNKSGKESNNLEINSGDKLNENLNNSEDVTNTGRSQKYRSLNLALISEFSNSPLQDITILDLSNLSICWESLPEASQAYSLETLLLSRNHLTEVRCVSNLPQLWKFDIRYNKISNLDFLIEQQNPHRLIGSLLLGWNQITDLTELFRFLAVTPVIELQISGNPISYITVPNNKNKIQSFQLTSEEITHLIVSLCPFIWVLDGHFISSEHRIFSQTYFSDLETKIRIRDRSIDLERMKCIISLKDKLKDIISKGQKTKREYKEPGRKVQSFLDFHARHVGLLSNNLPHSKMNDKVILQYLIHFFSESYLLERTLLVSEDIIRDPSLPNGLDIPTARHTGSSFDMKRNNQSNLGPPFHTFIIFSLDNFYISQFVKYLQSSMLFSINYRVECEVIHSILKTNPTYSSLGSMLKSVVVQEIAQIPPYGKSCFLNLINSHFQTENSYIPSNFSLEDKYNLASFLYKKVLSTSCYSDSNVLEEMRSLFDFVANLPSESPNSFETRPMAHSRIAITSARIIPSRNGRTQKQAPVYIDRSPKYILEDPEHASAFFYSSIRIPKEMEVVLFQDHWTTVLETLQNGVVVLNLQNPQKEYYAVPVRNMIWMPSGSRAGYWKVQIGVKKPVIDSSPKKSNISIFTSNDTWNSSFLISSKELVDELNSIKNENWTEITDNIPFRIFEVPDEFIIQPGKILTPSKSIEQTEKELEIQTKPPEKISRSSTFMTEVITNDIKDEADSHTPTPNYYNDATSDNNSPFSNRLSQLSMRSSQGYTHHNDVSSPVSRLLMSTPQANEQLDSSSRAGASYREDSQTQSTLSPTNKSSRHSNNQTRDPDGFIQTKNSNLIRSGMMQNSQSINLPNMIMSQSRNHQLQPIKSTPHVSNLKKWRVVPGKSQFIVHNPLELHPYTQKPEKKVKPIVNEPFTRYLKHDNLDKDITPHKIPEKPFRTRYLYNKHGAVSLRQKKLHSLVPRPDTPTKSWLHNDFPSLDQTNEEYEKNEEVIHEMEDNRFNMYGKTPKRISTTSSSIDHLVELPPKYQPKSRLNNHSKKLDPEDQEIFL